jgi:hypothetical protein
VTALTGTMHRSGRGWTEGQQSAMKALEGAVAAKQTLTLMDLGTLNALAFSAAGPDDGRRVDLLISRAKFERST